MFIIPNLTDLDLRNYKEYNEKYYSTGYYKNIKHTLKLHDIVKISDNISYNRGYEGHMGIVEGLSGLNEYVYVMAYNSDSKRYWVCGFCESDLIKLPTSLKYVNSQLREAYLDWLERNFFNFAPDDFKKQNVVYVDFIKKTIVL